MRKNDLVWPLFGLATYLLSGNRNEYGEYDEDTDREE